MYTQSAPHRDDEDAATLPECEADERLDAWTRLFLAYLTGRTGARLWLGIAALLVFTATYVVGLVGRDLEVIFGGQFIGWGLVVLAHALSRSPERSLERPSTIILDPVWVASECLARAGLRPGFIARAWVRYRRGAPR